MHEWDKIPAGTIPPVLDKAIDNFFASKRLRELYDVTACHLTDYGYLVELEFIADENTAAYLCIEARGNEVAGYSCSGYFKDPKERG